MPRAESRAPRAGRTTHLAIAGVIAAGVVIFSILSFTTRRVFDQTEDRLLEQRTAEAAAVLQVAIGQVQAPLDAALRVAEVTDGDPDAFTAALQTNVGGQGAFTSALLFRSGSAEPIAQVGEPAALLSSAERLDGLAHPSAPFMIIDLLADGRRLGYAVGDPSNPSYTVYGERTLSSDPTVRRRTDEPFADLDYAIYLGPSQDRAALLGASTGDLPMHGRIHEQTFQFGDHALLLVMRPTAHLSSDVFANLWWTILAFGAVATAAAAWLTRRLLLGRDTALALSSENRRLYEEQRQIAETLQLSLLPMRLDVPPAVEIAARYWPAGEAALIGGDFYDAFDVGDGRWAVAIGDVCGKGIESAAFIGLARHTLRTAARHSDSPSEVLRAVHRAMAENEPVTFCTVCFAFLTPRADGAIDVSLSLGGHPQPFLRRADGTVVSIGALGSLLGVFEPRLTDAAATLRPGDLLLLYTDGLTDAPASQAVPLDEIQETLSEKGDQLLEPLADDIRVLKRRRRPYGSGDDTAIMLVRLQAADRERVAEAGVHMVQATD